MATTNETFDSLEFVLKNGVPSEDWFEKSDLPEISSLIQKIKSTAEDVKSSKCENDKTILKLLQTTVAIAQRLLNHTKAKNSDDPLSSSQIQNKKNAKDNEEGIDKKIISENIVSHESNKSQSLSPRSVKEEGYGSEEKSENTPSSLTSCTFSRFLRGSGRLSMLNNNIDVWIEAADRQLNKLTLNENETESKMNEESVEECADISASNLENKDEMDQKSILYKFKLSDSKSLGMSIIPFPEKSPMKGIEIQDILKDGMIDVDGRLSVKDQIIEINGRTLSNVDFEQAQQIFKEALKGSEIILRVIKNQPLQSLLQPSPLKSSSHFPPPTFPKPLIKMTNLDAGMVEAEESSSSHQTKVATVTPTKKLSSTFGNVSNSNKSSPLSHGFGSGRKVGKKFYIKLTKCIEGLGFSITTRDNPAGDNCPIYIKNILPEGSAIQDGRLKIGDRLLEVNGIEMSGKSHTEAVTILRNIPLGSVVDLVVSRQEFDVRPSPHLPRQMPSCEASSDIASIEQIELLTFEIPLNDTGSAGLGISVKGRVSKTLNQDHTDLGIFVKNVINGGAASKDGRLKKDDRLISINGISLVGHTNSEAMEKLKRVLVSGEGPEATSNAITLTVARPIIYNKKSSHNLSFHSRNDSTISTDSTGEEQMFSDYQNKLLMNENSDNTVNSSFSRSAENTIIFNPKEVTTPSVKLDVQLNNPHPMSDCLIGSAPVKNKPSSPSSKSKHHYSHQTSESFGLNKKSERSDIYIDDDSINLQSSLITKPKYISSVIAYESSLKPVESDVSINGTDDGSFQRDGFGRQSISEKRHATIDAKNTDTYQRNRKYKDTKTKEKPKSKEETDPASYDSSTPVNRREEKKSESGPVKPARGIKSKNGILFSPHCCWNCQSPGSCPYHIVPHLVGQTIGPNLGLKKSSSLESLQTMMQELQREQLDSRGGNPFAGPRPATLKVPRNRITNESFRAAVDKSYDAPYSASGQVTMETVAEEETEIGTFLNPLRRHTNSPANRPSATTLSIAGTQCTATTTTSSQITTSDERDDLIRKKKDPKKKGLIKSLFHFGSKKEKSDGNISKGSKKDASQEAERIKAKRAAQLEQEKIQEHFKKFVEQQKSQKAVIQPTKQLSSLMQFHSDSSILPSQQFHSTPTTSHNNFQPVYDLSTPEKLAQLRLHNSRSSERFFRYNRVAPENGYGLDIADTANNSQLINGYGTKIRINPQYLYINSNDPTYSLSKANGGYAFNPPIRRAFSYRAPSSMKNQPFSELPPSTANNYDICKEAIERPGSRIGIVDPNDKYSHYVNYREIQQHLEYYQQFKTPSKSLKLTSSYNPYSTGSASLSTGDKKDLNTLPNSRRTPRMTRDNSSSIKDTRKSQRPLSNYEYDSAIQSFNITNANANQMSQQNQILSINLPSNVNYGFMQRNIANHSSLPRHQVSVNTVTNSRKPTIYHQTSQVKIYGSQFQNGLNSELNSNQTNHIDYQINSIGNQAYYGSLRYQRDQGSKI